MFRRRWQHTSQQLTCGSCSRSITSGCTNGLYWLHADRYSSGVAFFPSPTPTCAVTLLGTSAGAPSSTRSASGTLVQWANGSNFLVDAGDGTYERLMATAGAAVAKLDAIFITHLHGDHVLGLNALVTSALNPFASQRPDRQPWLVVGQWAPTASFGRPSNTTLALCAAR